MSSGVPETHLGAWRAVLNAHTSVVAHAEEALAAAELPPLAWYDVLWAIRRAPKRRIRMAELASSLTISRGGLTKLADRLENAGLIRREPADTDGRGLYAVLTAEGNTLLRRMWPVYSRALRESFVSAISNEEAALIAAALNRIDEPPSERRGPAREPAPPPRPHRR
jgi:DNA-binding MarR family transcriptional regulator